MRKCLSLIALLAFCLSVFAQTKTTTGRVTDQTGAPVPFATIRVKGTKSGTSADADGNFTIRTKDADVLVVSGAGITTKEIPVAGISGSLSIQVQHKENSLTEVVVTALGVQRQSKELGYATAKINT